MKGEVEFEGFSLLGCASITGGGGGGVRLSAARATGLIEDKIRADKAALEHADLSGLELLSSVEEFF